MFAILLEHRVKIQIKIQKKQIVINRHVNNHSLNVLHHCFKSLNVIHNVLIIDENDVLKFD
jgi:hypothetical protein